MKQVYFVFFELNIFVKRDIIELLGLEVEGMADICTCCGKKIPFLDIDYDLIKIGNEEYRLSDAEILEKYSDYRKRIEKTNW